MAGFALKREPGRSQRDRRALHFRGRGHRRGADGQLADQGGVGRVGVDAARVTVATLGVDERYWTALPPAPDGYVLSYEEIGAKIDECKAIGGVQILTPLHPLDPKLRREREFGKPIHIGSDVWVGGGALILPGVRIAGVEVGLALSLGNLVGGLTFVGLTLFATHARTGQSLLVDLPPAPLSARREGLNA